MKFVLALAAVFSLLAGAAAAAVGFQELKIANGDDRPLVVGIWYPTGSVPTPRPLGTFTQTVAADAPVLGARLPLVVMSHGTGGWYGGHYDTAIALAEAGFVVAAVSHTGDTWDDQSRVLRIMDRPGHIKRLIDYMTAEWTGHDRIDAARIGVFGFSAGGFTALVAAGGTPDFATLGPHCQAHPSYFDCAVMKRGPGGMAAVSTTPPVWVHDPRIKAAVVAAPALGFAFGKAGLAGLTVPVQLWQDDHDQILPGADYGEAVRLALPRPPEFHVVENAGHFDFLTPCDPELARMARPICTSRPGFDRAAFHTAFDAAVVAFFEKNLNG